jgi:MFS family permease
MKEDVKNRMLIFGLLSASTCLFFGYEVGIFNSFFQPFVDEVFGISDPEVQAQMKGTVSFLFLFGGTICSLTGGFLYQKIGFYNTLILMIVVDCVTCILFLMESMFLIYLARLIGGYFSCMAGLLPSLLIKRHLPEKEANRLLPSLYNFITFGILLAYWICVPENVKSWRLVLAFPLLFLIPLLVILYVSFPESSLAVPGPESAEDKAIEEKGVELHSRSSRGTDHDNTHHLSSDEALLPTKEREIGLTESFGPEYKTQMYLAIFLNVGNQLTGINFLIYYSTDIFTKVKLPNPPLLTVFIGVANFVGSIILTFVLGRYQKRDVLLYGIAGQALLMFLVVLGLLSDSGLLVLIGCYGFVFCFAISLGGEIGPYVVDIVPASAFAMTGLSQWVLACFVGKFAIDVMAALGETLCFFLLSLVAAVSTVIFLGYSVTTEGKTAHQIKSEFMSKQFLK